MGKRRCRHFWIPCHLQKRKCCSIVTIFQTKRKYDRSLDDVVTSTGEFEFTKFIFRMFGIGFPLDKQPFSGIIMSFSPDVLHFLSEIRFKTFYHRKSRSSIAGELDRVCIVFLLISHTLPKLFRSLDCNQKSMSHFASQSFRLKSVKQLFSNSPSAHFRQDRHVM